MNLHDCRVEGGDVEGHANLYADREPTYGGNENDRGTEGELNADVQIFCCGCESGWSKCRFVANTIRLIEDIYSRTRCLQSNRYRVVERFQRKKQLRASRNLCQRNISLGL